MVPTRRSSASEMCHSRVRPNGRTSVIKRRGILRLQHIQTMAAEPGEPRILGGSDPADAPQRGGVAGVQNKAVPSGRNAVQVPGMNSRLDASSMVQWRIGLPRHKQ